ncbi:MAG: type II toxin-antitoxin system Phd/YefM family antitoxin [Candidatus Binataceae bacterium]
MKHIGISEFKANCGRILERVAKSRRPVLVTRFGKPVAEIVPPPRPAQHGNWMGSLAHTMKIRGDIISPASDEEDWDALA